MMSGNSNTVLLARKVQQAQQGDEQALSELLVAAEPLIRRIAASSRAEDIDDVVQNVSLRLIQSLASLLNPEAFQSWLISMTRNESLLQHRARSRWHRAQLALAFESHSETSEPRDIPDLRSAIKSLPPSQQQLITERYVDGLSYQSTSQKMDVSIGVLKSRLHRARRRLRKEIDMSKAPESIPLSRADLASLARASQFRATTGDAPISGLLLTRTGFAIATDGHRLAMHKVAPLSKLDCDLLVMPNAIDALHAASVDRAEDQAKLTVRLDEVQLDLQDEKLAWGIREAEYPDYEAVLPDKARFRLRLASDDFFTAYANLEPFLEQAHPAIAGLDYLPMVVLGLNTDTGTLRLSVTQSTGYLPAEDGVDHLPAPGSVRWRHQVSIKTREAHGFTEGFQISVNARYLQDAVLAVGSSEVEFSFTTANKPIDISGDGHRVVTMPMG